MNAIYTIYTYTFSHPPFKSGELFLYQVLVLVSVTCLSHSPISLHNRSTHPHLNTLRQQYPFPLPSTFLLFVCLFQTTAISYIILLSDPIFAVSNHHCPFFFLFLFNFTFSLQLLIHCAHLFIAEDALILIKL